MTIKRTIYVLLTLIFIGLFNLYAVNYYKEYDGDISKEAILGSWQCIRSSGYTNGSINASFEFNPDNKYQALYKIVVFGNGSNPYEFNISGTYSLSKNIIRLNLDKMVSLQKGRGNDDPTYKMLKEAFEPSDDKFEDNVVLSLDEHKLVFTPDKKSKFICHK